MRRGACSSTDNRKVSVQHRQNHLKVASCTPAVDVGLSSEVIVCPGIQDIHVGISKSHKALFPQDLIGIQCDIRYFECG